MSAIAVALHDVEPATFERCALIRDWLADCGVDRCTLLVIPAPDSHPFYQRRPELADWLLERVAAGDAVAQHGFRHHRASAARGRLAGRSDRSAEFPGLKPEETVAGVEAGQRTLALAGLDPRGFVAPAYAYTPALRAERRSTHSSARTLPGRSRSAGCRSSRRSPEAVSAPARTAAGDSVRCSGDPPRSPTAGAILAPLPRTRTSVDHQSKRSRTTARRAGV